MEGEKGTELKRRKVSHKLRAKELQRIIALSIEGESCASIANILKKEFDRDISAPGVFYHLDKHRDEILRKKKDAYERSVLQFSHTNFEGRMREAEELIEKLKALPENIGKYRAISSVLKDIAIDEYRTRMVLIKEKENSTEDEEQGNFHDELKEIMIELSEENIKINELAKLAGWE